MIGFIHPESQGGPVPHELTEKTSKSKVYRELRRSIIMGHRKPGERLSLDELTKSYGTGITPLRDALQMLSQEGLVTIKPRSGYFVRRITLKELAELFEVREILELAAVERAAPLITEPQLDQLEHVHAGYTGDDDESYDRYTDENRRFHYLLALASANHELAEMLAGLHDRLARFMVLRGAGKTQEYTHAQIVQALRAGDVDEARQAMLAEINETREAVLGRVIQEEGASWQLRA
jgi:GntR family transcriptional regulator, rspAB operon transcriptional repressor